jgi:hypothetical protein
MPTQHASSAACEAAAAEAVRTVRDTRTEVEVSDEGERLEVWRP